MTGNGARIFLSMESELEGPEDEAGAVGVEVAPREAGSPSPVAPAGVAVGAVAGDGIEAEAEAPGSSRTRLKTAG